MEYLLSLFQGLSYEEGFGPSEVPYAIVSVIGRANRKEIFGEDRVLQFFLKHVWFHLANNMNKLMLVYSFANAQGIKTSHTGRVWRPFLRHMLISRLSRLL